MSSHLIQRATGRDGKWQTTQSKRRRLRRNLLLQAMEARSLLAGDAMMQHTDEMPAIVSEMIQQDSTVSLSPNTQHQSDDGQSAHPNDPGKAAEHAAALALVDPVQATNTVVASGDWSDPKIWADQAVPGDGARIVIPEGLTVTVDGMIEEEFYTLRVDGTLRFDPSVHTELRVDTLVSSPSGTLQMGTAQTPIVADITARIVVADTGEIDRAFDPTGLSRGLILHGRTEIHGAAKTSWSTLAQAPRAGDMTLTLSEMPDGWQEGDSLVIAGTRSDATGDEVVTISSIDGTTIELEEALEFDHVPPAEDLQVHVANTSRNAVIESENTELERRGHVMFMHNPDVQVSYAGFYELGRSDKLNELNLNELDEDGELIEGSGTNLRGRYSVHFHRQGVRANSTPATVVGSSVVGSPGWGYVNHSSNVDFINNVSYDVDGAAYNTESGDEIGSFINNLSIRTHGTGDIPVSRQDEGDFGHAGDGFWIQGGSGITIEGNVAAGATGSGLIIYGEGLFAEDQPETMFLAENLSDPSLAGEAETVPVSLLLLRSVKDNVSYGSAIGLQTYYHRSPVVLEGAADVVANPQFPDSVIEDVTVWNSATGVKVNYTLDTQFKNVRVLNSADDPGNVGFDVSNVYNDAEHLYENFDIRGYETGLKPSPNGQITVDGGTFANQTDIQITLPRQNHRRLEITGEVTFADLKDNGAFDSATRQNIVMDANPAILVDSSELWFLYHDQVILNHNGFSGQQLFYNEQAADFVPFPSQPPQVTPDDPGAPIGEQFIGATNAEMREFVGASLAGTLPTEDAIDTPDDGIVGLIGSVADPPAFLVEPFLLGEELDDEVEDDAEEDDGDEADVECDAEDESDDELDFDEEDEDHTDAALDEDEEDEFDDSGEDDSDGADEDEDEVEIDESDSDEDEPEDLDESDSDDGEDDEEDESDVDESHQDDQESDESDFDDSGEVDIDEDDDHSDETHEEAAEREDEIDLHNEDEPTDVNNDGSTTTLDALLVLNFLSRQGTDFLQTLSTALQYYVDVNGDRAASALDALQIINALDQLLRTTAPIHAVDTAIALDFGEDEEPEDELLTLLSQSPG